MFTRSMTSTMTGRAAAARRLRRRAGSTARLYCHTNGCTTTMVVDADGATAHCPICGATRRIG